MASEAPEGEEEAAWEGLPAWPEAQAKTQDQSTWPQAQQAAEVALDQQAAREAQPGAAFASCLPAWPVAQQVAATVLTLTALQSRPWPCYLSRASWRHQRQSQRAKG